MHSETNADRLYGECILKSMQVLCPVHAKGCDVCIGNRLWKVFDISSSAIVVVCKI